MSSTESALVTSHWLRRFVGRADHDVVVLDASIGAPRDPDQGIPGAKKFDIDGEFSRADVDLPHTMVSADRFQALASSLGVNQDTSVVVYDAAGIYSSARAWWMFRAMGHRRVAVLDGGLPGWVSAGFPVEAFTHSPKRVGNFVARPDPSAFVTQSQVAARLDDAGCVVLDARSPERFAGTAPEPREGLRGGHMPGSRSLPVTDLVVDSHLLPPAELAAAVRNHVPDGAKVIASCGSGVTACVIALAAHLTGVRDITVYDGSWSEWGRADGPPVDTGSLRQS